METRFQTGHTAAFLPKTLTLQHINKTNNLSALVNENVLEAALCPGMTLKRYVEVAAS